MDFQRFEKIPRLNRDIVITEKIDGTNAQVFILDLDSHIYIENYTATIRGHTYILDNWAVFAGSRSRWIQPGKSTDNAGFAGWVRDNVEELIIGLGPGRHFGEWWGQSIQRNYGLDEKRFSLFNTARWTDDVRPKCCHVVPILYEGERVYKGVLPGDEWETAIDVVTDAVESLTLDGSSAAPGFMNPEGVIVWHTAARQMFKVTCKDDEKPKGQP